MNNMDRAVSPYRWVILIASIPIIISTEIMWLTFSPIASVIAENYGVSGFAVDMLATSYMLMFIIFCIPASYVIDKYGFRTSLLIGAILTGVFGILRAACSDSFTIVMISQFMLAVGQPFILNITTKAAANWFPFEERATADGLLTMAQYIGFAIPMVLSPILSESIGIRGMLYVFAIIAVCALVLVLIFIKEKPEIAPPGAAFEREDFSRKAIMSLFKNKAYVLALAVSFISMGIFNTILTLIESLLMPRGISSAEAGIIGAVFVVAGIIGAVILPILSDKASKRKNFLLLAIILLVPLYLGLTLVKSFIILAIIAGIAGFSIMGVAPILFQHSTEVAYPAQEGTSMGLILLMGQISGALFVILFEAISGASDSVVIPMLGMVALTAIEIPIIGAMKESSLVEEHEE